MQGDGQQGGFRAVEEEGFGDAEVFAVGVVAVEGFVVALFAIAIGEVEGEDVVLLHGGVAHDGGIGFERHPRGGVALRCVQRCGVEEGVLGVGRMAGGREAGDGGVGQEDGGGGVAVGVDGMGCEAVGVVGVGVKVAE